MSSLVRRIQRKRQRVAGTHEASATPYRIDPDAHGYSNVHSTKGWRHYARRRIAAGVRLQAMIAGELPWRFGSLA